MIHVVLYQPEKPANVGNIIRTCRASGSTLHIIGPLTFRLDEPSLKRAGMDYLEGFSYQTYDSIEDFFALFPSATMYYITRYGQRIYSEMTDVRVDHDVFFLFGKESSGLPSDLLLAHPDRCLRIPMRPSTRSLNLANCVAIIVYEALRQEEFYGLSTVEALKGEDYLRRKLKG